MSIPSLAGWVKHAFHRANNSAVAWSWAFNGLRLASGIFLLPLLLHKLPKPEFGMYYAFLSITGLVMVLEFGFGGVVGRFAAYAMCGATSFQAQGFVPPPKGAVGPNLGLLWQLIRTTRTLYRYLALNALLVMGIWGTILVNRRVNETSSPTFTWLAWGVTLLVAAAEVYSNWWTAFLFHLNRVRDSSRICFTAYVARLVISCALLLAGGGLLSVPIGGVVGVLLNRHLSKRAVFQVLGEPPSMAQALSQRELLRLLWPNSWRFALIVFSNYLRANGSTAICVSAFGLIPTAQYGLSVQVMGVAMGMATVWTSVKWPLAMQLRSAHNLPALQKMLWPRAWLQLITFVVLSGAAICAGPFLLRLIGTDKQMLPTFWLTLLGLGTLLEMHYIFWGTLLSVENRIPTLWATVFTNAACLALALGLSYHTGAGLRGLVLAPLLTGLVLNFWYWPLAGAWSLDTNWLRFMFSRRSLGAEGAASSAAEKNAATPATR